MIKLYLLTISAALFLFSCRSATKSFDRGDYREAIERSIKKLQKDPTDSESIQILKDAYTMAANQHHDRIRTLSGAKSSDRFAAIYREYVQLQSLYQLIRQYPAANKVVHAVNYAEYMETYRDKAAEVHIANAEKWEAQQTKPAFREAYKEYRQAVTLKPGDIDLIRRKDNAYHAALTKILVIPMQQHLNGNGYGYNNSYQLQNFQNDIMRSLSFNMGSEFVKFYSEWELRNRNLDADQVLELNLGRMMLGRPVDERSTREATKRVVVKETVYKPDSVIKEYATVKARITTTRRTLISEGDLYIALRDVRGRTIWNDRFTGQHRWQTSFVTYTGDERALSDSDRAQLNRRDESIPSEDEVIDRLFREINEQLTYRLRNYFARY